MLVDAGVVGRSVSPPYTGGRTWVVLTVWVASTQSDILVPYFSAEQAVPDIGDVCDFKISLERVNGVAGDHVINATFNVVDNMKCKSKEKLDGLSRRRAPR